VRIGERDTSAVRKIIVVVSARWTAIHSSVRTRGA